MVKYVDKRFAENFETIGIEFEYELGKPFSENFQQVHDGSIITDRKQLGNFILDADNDFGLRMHDIQTGQEFITGIVNTNDLDNLFEILNELTAIATEYGEENTIRSGIHYHISVSNPSLPFLKSVIKLAERYERLFFNLFTMGGTFRGIFNDSNYCRPLHNPQVTKIKTINEGVTYGYSYYVDDLLEATGITDFFDRYGDSIYTNTKYHPVRYGWLNLFTLAPGERLKNTIEFRGFNKTLNPFYMYATIVFCKRFLVYALLDSASLNLPRDKRLITSPYTKNDIFDDLEEFSNYSGLDDPKILEALHNIISSSPYFELKDEPVFTHLNSFKHILFTNTEYKPAFNYLDDNKIKRPNYIDYHVLRGEV